MYNDIQQLVGTDMDSINAWSFSINLLIAALLAYLLSVIYSKYGNSLSNRRNFGRNFVLLAVTTMLVISIVKSSLALSLGLVGALSIVRFRSAIKEPEELAYVFLAIAIGLGMGAGQRLITVIAFVIIIIIIILAKLLKKEKVQSEDMIMNIVGGSPLDIEKVIEVLKSHSQAVKLKRVVDQKEKLDASFVVQLKDMNAFSNIKSQLQSEDPNVEIVFLDNQGMY